MNLTPGAVERLKEIYGRVIGPIKRLLWWMLRQLDDSFATAPAALPLPPPRARFESIDSPSPSIPTIVVNEGGLLATPSHLALAFGAMFGPASGWDAVARELWTRASAARCPDHEALAQLLEARLAELARGTPDDTRVLRAIEQLARHLRVTEESRTAYLVTGKPNPDAVFWPDPTRGAGARSLYSELPLVRARGSIDRTTPIGSAGSCFAMEIAHRLQRDGFNYVITEPDANPARGGLSNACARWGILFNTPSFRQLVAWAFGEIERPRILWTSSSTGAKKFYDPFREGILFDSIEEYEADLPVHRERAREALLRARTFVITLGVNEVWTLKADGTVFSRAPWKVAPHLVERHVMTVDENVREIEAMLGLWRRRVPDLELIVSVSPVPLHATFRAADQHVIAANAHSKATLRVVADELARRNPGVTYFPSYEVVTQCVKEAWEADQSHVSRAAVDRVMELFGQMFVRA